MAGKASKRRTDVTEPLFSEEEVCEAFRETMGCVAESARRLDCDRTTLFLYVRNYPKVRQALDDARQSYKETCESFAKDNHLQRLMYGDKEATAYELAKLEPKPEGQFIDTTKLTAEELVQLRALLLKAKPDGAA